MELPRAEISVWAGPQRVGLCIQGVPCGISLDLKPPGYIFEIGDDVCTVLSDILLHKL